MTATPKHKRGGARAGAGRPRSSRVRGTTAISARVEPEYHEALGELATAFDLPVAQVLRAMIRAAKTPRGFKALHDCLKTCLPTDG
jgi:hypothetical protein